MRYLVCAAAIAVAAFLAAAASASGTTYSAVIKRSGLPETGFGLVSSLPEFKGAVRVTFASDVSNCAYVASVGNYRGRAPLYPGLISVASGTGAVVLVRMTDGAGHLNRRGFQLQVSCPFAAVGRRHPSVWAVVDASGSLVRGTLVQSVTKIRTGDYRVKFAAFVTHCAPVATLGDPGTAEITAPGTAAAKRLDANTIEVDTFDPTRRKMSPPYKDKGFHLQVACADQKPPDYSAVVSDDGSFVRGIDTLGASRIAKGQYEVDFPRDISACSFAGTLGLPGDSGTVVPGMINVATRSGNANAVLVQSFGTDALPADSGFHLAVRC
jgi:hypothetical protein